MLASVSQVRDDAAHAQCVEARRFGGCDHAGGDHSMRAGLRQDRDGHCRQVHEEPAGHHDVRWVRVPFNAALAPGPKTFDANLSEFSITDQRKAAVDFSSPYFDVTQAVVTVKSSPAAGVKTVHQLRTLRLGVQVGTTSYTATNRFLGRQ
jgi:hypothetical protein